MKFHTRLRDALRRLRLLLLVRLKRIRALQSIPKRLTRNSNGINVHLGCGAIDHPGFINVDMVYHPHIHLLRPIDELSIFSDGSVDLIYASHCLEHFEFRKVPAVLAEWRRIVRKGGILRLSVPDFDRLLQAYSLAGGDLTIISRAIVGGQDYKYNFHYSVFNERLLTNLLFEAGFTEVKSWSPESEALTRFDDWASKSFNVDGHRIPISLNIEATK